MKYFGSLNCFTDASVSNYRGKNCSCAGFVLVHHDQIIDSGIKIIPQSTNNEGEAMAVLMGVRALLSYSYMEEEMNLFSDSKITIDGLNVWSKKWVKHQTDDNILLSSTGKPVANQDIFKTIIRMIYYKECNISLWHILGHKNFKSEIDKNEIITAFIHEYGMKIPHAMAEQLCYYNDIVDTITRNKLIESIKTKEIDGIDKFSIPVVGILTKDIMSQYFKYIGG